MENIRPILKNKNKKAQGFIEFFFVIIFLLALCLVIVVLNKAWSEVKDPLNEGLTSAMPDDTSVNITETLDQTSGSTLMFDKLLPFILIGLFGFMLMMAGGFMNHPIMIFVGIIILGVALMVAGIYSNIYNSITESDEFSDTKADLPIQDKFMQYLPVIVFLIAIAIFVAILWNKKGGGTGTI